MSRVALSGASLIAATAAHLIGSTLESRLAGISWSIGAWLALTAAALIYRRMAHGTRRALPATAMAMLGLVASFWTIETTLRIALGGRSSNQDGWWAALPEAGTAPLPLLAVVGAGVGLALFASAAWHAGLVPRPVGALIAIVAMLGVVTGAPPVPYVLGAAPLGIALLWTLGPPRPAGTGRHMYPDVPMFMVAQGDVVRMTISNHSGEVHPMHLHGHHAIVLSRDGVAATGTPWWVDSLNVNDGESYEIAFVADNPGIWVDHCHNLNHAGEGLLAHLMYEGVTTPFLVGGSAGNEPE